MGTKVVCLACRKAFSLGTDFNNRKERVCPECGKPMLILPHRFRPPKSNDTKRWETVNYLIENGFYYQHIHDDGKVSDYYNRVIKYVEYPENLNDAKEFVKRYKDQAIKP